MYVCVCVCECECECECVRERERECVCVCCVFKIPTVILRERENLREGLPLSATMLHAHQLMCSIGRTWL